MATTVLGPTAWADVGDRTRAGPSEPAGTVLGALRQLQAELGGRSDGPGAVGSPFANDPPLGARR